MRMRLLFFCLLLFSVNSFAQEKNQKTFILISKGSESDITPYITAMEKADFSCHRIRNKRRPIEFKTGVRIELLSAQEVMLNGLTPSTNCLSDETVLDKKQPVYQITTNGHIAEIHDGPDQPKKNIKR